MADTQAGLVGPIVIAKKGSLGSHGKPADVDREIFLMLQVRGGARGIGVGRGVVREGRCG